MNNPDAAEQTGQALNGWVSKAESDTYDSGVQDTETLLRAMEAAVDDMWQIHYAHQQSEIEPREQMANELADLGALCVQLRWSLLGYSMGDL